MWEMTSKEVIVTHKRTYNIPFNLPAVSLLK